METHILLHLHQACSELILFLGCPREESTEPYCPWITCFCTQKSRTCGAQDRRGTSGRLSFHEVDKGGNWLFWASIWNYCVHAHSQVKAPAPIKALPVPHYLPFQPKPAVKNTVEMCPFSFEQREQERRAQKEKRLELRNDEVWPLCYLYSATISVIQD